MNPSKEYIILFDGVCNLCNGAIAFIIKHDHVSKFSFAPLQSTVGQALLQNFKLADKDIDTVVYIRHNMCYTKSSAALLILKDMKGYWKLCYVCIIVPKPIRDFVYNFIAKKRYGVFGVKNECMIPTADIRNRFLE